MNNAPIGIIDSGSGGLSVFQSIRSSLPKESIYILEIMPMFRTETRPWNLSAEG